MKCFGLGLLVVVLCLGTPSSAGLFSRLNSAVSDTTGMIRSTAVAATSAAKNTAQNVAGTVQAVNNKVVDTAQSAVKAVSTGAINTGLAVLFAQIRGLAKATNNKEIAIPDMYMSKGPIAVNATNGYFKDISTLKQVGSANVTMNGTATIIAVAVKLDDISTGYNNVTLSLLKLKARGGIRIHIANDTIVIQMRLKPGLTCALNVDKVQITEFEGIEVDFINMGSKSEFVLEKVSNLIVKFMKENIKKQVQTAIDNNLRKYLKENGAAVCSKFFI